MRELLFLLTLFSVSAFGQKGFTGTYFTNKKDIGFESDIFQFEKDGTFRYIFFTCTGVGLGKGNYEIDEGDSLRLQFTDCDECNETKEIEVFTDPSEKLEIDLLIKAWEDESPIAGVSVYFPKERIGTVSDQNGIARFSTGRLKDSEKLTIQFVGYDPVEIEIPIECSRLSGTVRLSYHWIYDHTDTKAFKITRWTRSKLKLKRYPNVDISYGKVSKSIVIKLIEERMGEIGYKLYTEKIAK